MLNSLKRKTRHYWKSITLSSVYVNSHFPSLFLHYFSVCFSDSLQCSNLSCVSFHRCLLDGNIHKDNNLVACGNGTELSGAEMEGEIASCAPLYNNIVMLDYPLACWHCPTSPWIQTPAENQPTASGDFYRKLPFAFTVRCGITFTCAHCLAKLHWFGASLKST